MGLFPGCLLALAVADELAGAEGDSCLHFAEVLSIEQGPAFRVLRGGPLGVSQQGEREAADLAFLARREEGAHLLPERPAVLGLVCCLDFRRDCVQRRVPVSAEPFLGHLR